MSRFYTILLTALLVLSTNTVFAATVQPSFDPLVVEYTIPEWKSVGHDTCKRNPGCTATWAMNAFQDAGVLPPAIAAQARADFMKAEIAQAAGETPEWSTYHVNPGDIVASSFSNKDAELVTVSYLRATFLEPAPGLGWTYVDYVTGKMYEVFRVIECGNYTVRVVTPAVAGSISTPLYAAFVPQHRSYGSGHRFGGASFGGIGGGGGTSSGGDSFTNYLTQVTNVTNITNINNEFCAICCEPKNPDPETPAPVPLPASGILMLAALGRLAYLRRRKTS